MAVSLTAIGERLCRWDYVSLDVGGLSAKHRNRLARVVGDADVVDSCPPADRLFDRFRGEDFAAVDGT